MSYTGAECMCWGGEAGCAVRTRDVIGRRVTDDRSAPTLPLPLLLQGTSETKCGDMRVADWCDDACDDACAGAL